MGGHHSLLASQLHPMRSKKQLARGRGHSTGPGGGQGRATPQATVGTGSQHQKGTRLPVWGLCHTTLWDGAAGSGLRGARRKAPEWDVGATLKAQQPPEVRVSQSSNLCGPVSPCGRGGGFRGQKTRKGAPQAKTTRVGRAESI